VLRRAFRAVIRSRDRTGHLPVRLRIRPGAARANSPGWHRRTVPWPKPSRLAESRSARPRSRPGSAGGSGPGDPRADGRSRGRLRLAARRSLRRLVRTQPLGESSSSPRRWTTTPGSASTAARVKRHCFARRSWLDLPRTRQSL